MKAELWLWVKGEVISPKNLSLKANLYSLIHSLNILERYVPDCELDTWDTAMNKTDKPCL